MDKNLVKKVMTFKSGKFTFSRRYDQVAIDKLLIEAQTLREAVEDLPVLPAWSSWLEEELIRRYIHSTAALEGNPLSEEQVGEIIVSKQDDQSLSKAEREIANLKIAYQDCRNFSDAEGGLLLMNEDFIQAIHRGITKGIDHPTNAPGVYREHVVKVGNQEHGGVYTPPKIRPDIEKLMKELVAWLNSPEVLTGEPLIRAALAHFHFAAIHPFADGNGRTARLLEAVILRADGLKYVPDMLSNYYYNHMDEYYWAFSRSERNKQNDITPFLTFVLNAFITSLRDLKQRIGSTIRRLTLRDYVAQLRAQKEITLRQYDLLSVLVEYSALFTIHDLFSSPPFAALYRDVSRRTANRDIEKLKNMRLLIEPEKGKFATNFHVLDKS